MKIKRLLKSILAGAMAFSISLNAFSVVSLADMTLNDKINDIYSHIENETIRNMYIEATTYCVTDNSNSVVFTVPKVPEIYDFPVFLRTQITTTAAGCTFTAKFATNKDDSFINQNAAGIEVLYNLCQQASAATAGMSDEQKMNYVMSFVMNNLTYDSAYSNIQATSTVTFFEKLNAGAGVCSEFCELYYIVAKYIGLDARIITGTLNGNGHSWIRVNINGTSYDIEATKGKFTSSYMQNNTYVEKVRTDSFDENYALITSQSSK